MVLGRYKKALGTLIFSRYQQLYPENNLSPVYFFSGHLEICNLRAEKWQSIWRDQMGLPYGSLLTSRPGASSTGIMSL